MEEITLRAEPRTVIGKQVRQLRRSGWIPAVIYGHRTQPIAVQVEERALRRVLQRAGGNQLIRLEVGDREAHTVLVREVQREPIKRRLLHVDLYEVVMTERIRTEIPVVFTGTSPMVASGEGLLYQGIQAVEVECLPGDLIPNIEVDLSELTEIGQEIAVGDLELGDRFEVLSNPDDVVARVLPVEEGVVEEEAAPAAEAEVEVAGREREEEEGEGE